MANYQVLFNGEVAQSASIEAVRDNLARELGLDDRKAKQLFSGRTVVIRSQLDHEQAQAWADKLATLGAICRVKDLTPTPERATFQVDNKADRDNAEQTLRDITAAHLECPRCGHMQLDSSHCARCGVDLEAAFRQKSKEDLLIEKKIRELRAKRNGNGANGARETAYEPEMAVTEDEEKSKKGMLGWFKRRSGPF